MSGSDPALAALVNLVERFQITDWHLWLSVPGGLISGEIVSTRRFLEEFTELLAIEVRNQGGEVVQNLSFSELVPMPDAAPETPEYLHLLSPIVVSGAPAVPLRASLTRVKLSDVAAWGLGQIEPRPSA
jgi:hypothetical protein